MAVATAPETRSSLGTPVVRQPDGQATVTRLWVAHGAVWLLLIAYVWTSWIVSGDFRANTIGRGLEPTWYVIVVRCVEIGFGVLLSGWILWRLVLAPKRRTGSLSFDGLFFLACWLMFFQEPWMNWINLQFLYATTFVNFGSWLNHIPGWSLPNARLIPVPAVYGMAYLWMVGLGGWAGSRYMSRQRRRDPGRSNGRLLLQTFVVMMAVDLVVESIMVHLQLISYPRTIPSLTLWAGTDHQFPLYETLSWPGTFIIISSLHFFRDDRGRSWPERGIDRIGIRNGKLHTLARFAAIAGVCQLAILVTFNIPYQVWGLHAGPVPRALLDRPWRMAGVCGPGTRFDCNGLRVRLRTPRVRLASAGSSVARTQGRRNSSAIPRPEDAATRRSAAARRARGVLRRALHTHAYPREK